MSRLGDAAILLVLGVVVFFLGRASAETCVIGEETTQVDTLYIRDTITREKPSITRVYVRDSIFVTLRDTVTRQDTVWLPREVKVYEDERYRAEVSGYQPSLDRIDIYVPERVVTKVVETRKPARWGIGVQVGYGAQIDGGKIRGTPYVGVGISYNILTF